jgi:hypothetical protein
MRAKISVPKLDKRSMANRMIADNMRRKIEETAPWFDFDAFYDPTMKIDEFKKYLRDRHEIYLEKVDDRPIGPDGKVLNGTTFCLYCHSEICYNRKSKKFCCPYHRKLYWLEHRNDEHKMPKDIVDF